MRVTTYVLLYGDFFIAGFHLSTNLQNVNKAAFYGVPAVIAINMIMAGASGGTVAVLIAVWAQVGWHEDLGITCSLTLCAYTCAGEVSYGVCECQRDS